MIFLISRMYCHNARLSSTRGEVKIVDKIHNRKRCIRTDIVIIWSRIEIGLTSTIVESHNTNNLLTSPMASVATMS